MDCMRKLLGQLIWLGFLIVAGPAILGIVWALAHWLFLGLVTVIAVCVVIAAVMAVC